MCKVWGVATRKGGVGKTTTSTTMAYLLAKAGYKVALIDFDGQRHSTKLSGVMLPEKLPITIYEILSSLVMGEELPEIETYIIHTESGVDLIPANNRLDYFDKLMCNTDFAEYKLKEYVDTIRDRYDYILIDGMPKMGTAMINIMISCDGLIVPVQSETLAVEGMGEFMRAFHRIKTLTFELVYPISLQIAKERGYLDKMMAFESDNEVTGKQFEEIRAKLNEYVESVKPL